MGIQLQLFFVIASLLTLLFVIHKIRKLKLNIDDSIIWMLWALGLLLFSIFPAIPSYLSSLFGFESPSNFILCLFIFFLYILMFYQTITISSLKEKNKELIQKISIEAYKDKEK